MHFDTNKCYITFKYCNIQSYVYPILYDIHHTNNTFIIKKKIISNNSEYDLQKHN